MPEVYQARNVQEAVEMAEGFKDAGKYDWFRGQTRDWPPHSSHYRLRARQDEKEIRRTEERLVMFFQWLRGCEELKAFADFSQERNVHAIFAILQHYGIPTNYLDFSTDPGVAGFFAADTRNPEKGAASCIYCLNTADLMRVWDCLKDFDFRKGAEIELVAIDVSNLWRLEAQKGVFLYANFNWEIDYPMDRILFPYTGYPPYPTREMIYPPQKSPLEAVLDRYFDVEQSTFSSRMLREWLASIGENAITDWEHHPDCYYAPAFADGKLEPLPSWAPEKLSGWVELKEETIRDASGPQVPFSVPAAPEADELRAAVRYGVGRMLRADGAARTRMFSFRLEGIADEKAAREIPAHLVTVWNGMRRLPFSDADITEACGSVAGLYLLGFQRFDPKGRLEAFSRLLGDGFEVGFTNQDRSSSKGCAARASLQQALRKDIADLLVEEHQERAQDCYELFRVAYSPQRLFEFPEFVSLFAREVIPTQVLDRTFVLYSPARLVAFGIP
jgi:FRG domain